MVLLFMLILNHFYQRVRPGPQAHAAPSRIGASICRSGSTGAVVTRDVPANALAVARGRQEVREEWAAKFRSRHKKASKS